MSTNRDLPPAEADTFRVLEERLSFPSITESRESLAALVAEDFQEHGSSGRAFGTDAVLEALIPGGRPRILLEDFTATVVAAGVVLVRYVSRSVTGAGWKPSALRSSLWTHRKERWQLLFHQGTQLPAEER